MLSVILGVIDAAVGAYLIRYAVRRERRDKDAVLVTGIFLLVCACLLVLLGAARARSAHRRDATGPAGVTEPEAAPVGPSYVRTPGVIVVRVTVRGGVHDGQVLGWRGNRVYVSYRTVDGNHLAWVPAEAVERV